jgi:hypothetical protein
MAERRFSKPAVGGSTPLTRFMDGFETRCCSRCKEEKPLTDFGKESRGRAQYYCRQCRSVYHREHYLRNKRDYISSAKRRVERMLEVMRAAKAMPCADCGVQYPFYVMDFDHREGEDKLGNVTRLRYMAEETLRAEISKCDIVCANCHRERTWKRTWSRSRKVKRSLL